jgi:hypothetical protein
MCCSQNFKEEMSEIKELKFILVTEKVDWE